MNEGGNFITPRGQIPLEARAARVIHVHIEKRMQQKIYVDKCERAQRRAVKTINNSVPEFLSKMQGERVGGIVSEVLPRRARKSSQINKK